MANNAESPARQKKSKFVQTACDKKRSKATMGDNKFLNPKRAVASELIMRARMRSKMKKDNNGAARAPRIWIRDTKQKYAVRPGTEREATLAAQAERAKKTTWEPQEWKEHLEEVMAPFRRCMLPTCRGRVVGRAPRIRIAATKQKYAVRKGTEGLATLAAQAARAKKTTWEPQEWKEHLEEVMAPFRKGVMHGGSKRRVCACCA
jgi:hypothetical protein